jgi:hypothetical protein
MPKLLSLSGVWTRRNCIFFHFHAQSIAESSVERLVAGAAARMRWISGGRQCSRGRRCHGCAQKAAYFCLPSEVAAGRQCGCGSRLDAGVCAVHGWCHYISQEAPRRTHQDSVHGFRASSPAAAPAQGALGKAPRRTQQDAV